MFPISRDPPEGGTRTAQPGGVVAKRRFQFLGIPPKGELDDGALGLNIGIKFPISRDPPEGGT